MAEITASMVKELRDKTGAGMMDCKSALNETGGDMEAAVGLAGETAGLITEVKTAKDIIDGMTAEFLEITTRMGSLAEARNFG